MGSLLRTAEGLGVARVILSGYTPYPLTHSDKRLPHEARKIHAQIQKTALGAEDTVDWSHTDDIFDTIQALRHDDFLMCALEQTVNAVKLPTFAPPAKVALIVGREVEGLESEIVKACDKSLEIPMLGQKESFNVVQAAAMALYHCTFC